MTVHCFVSRNEELMIEPHELHLNCLWHSSIRNYEVFIICSSMCFIIVRRKLSMSQDMWAFSLSKEAYQDLVNEKQNEFLISSGLVGAWWGRTLCFVSFDADSCHLSFLSDSGLPQHACGASRWEDHAWCGYAPGGCGDRDVRLQLQAAGPPPQALRPRAALGGHRRGHGSACTAEPLPGCDSPSCCLPGDPTTLLRGPEIPLKQRNNVFSRVWSAVWVEFW